MTSLLEDSDLLLPEPPTIGEPPHADVGALELASAAVTAPFLLEGAKTLALGGQRGAVDLVRIAGRVVATEVTGQWGVAANVVVSPGVLRREWVGPAGTTIETVLAAASLPLVAVRWRGTGADRASEISLVLHGPGTAPAYRIGPASISLGRADEVSVACVTPRPDAIDVQEEGATRLRVRVRPAAGPTTLLLAAGPADRVKAAVAASAHLAAQLRLAREARLDGGLSLATGIAEVDDGFHWARVRLRAALTRPETGSRFWATLAAAAVGDMGAAAAGLERLARTDPVRAAIAASSYTRTFDDPGPATRFANALLEESAGGPTDRPPTAPLRRVALTALADALHGAASDALIAGLRASAERTSRGPVRLPTIGSAPPAPDMAAWLQSLLAGEPVGPAPAVGDPATHALFALPSRFRAEPDIAWTDWRTTLAEGLSGGPAGPGTWDGIDEEGEIGLAGSRLLLGLAVGVLGLSPDARVGRVRIAPRLPSHLTAFRVDGVTAGATRLSLIYARDGDLHRITLEPESASVPPTVVLEPSVPGMVTRVTLDGAPAELEPRRSGSRTIVPIQVPLDRTRSLEIFTGR